MWGRIVRRWQEKQEIWHAYPVNTTTHDRLLDFADGSPSLAQYADIGGLNRIGMKFGNLNARKTGRTRYSKFMDKWFAVALLIFGANPLTAGIWDELSLHQHCLLETGASIVVEVPVKDNPWPEFIVYKLVSATAERMASVFWDFEKTPEFVPNCVSAETFKTPSPLEKLTKYHLRMPMWLPDEVYISDERALTLPTPGSEGPYKFTWKVTKSRYITSGIGRPGN